MVKKGDTQTTISDYEIKQVGINTTAYSILRVIKNNLIMEHKKNFTFSDAIIELKNMANGSSIKFTKAEVEQIKTTLKGGKK